MILNTIHNIGNSLYLRRPLNQNEYNSLKQYLEYPYSKSIYKKIIRYYTITDKIKNLNKIQIYNYTLHLEISLSRLYHFQIRLTTN